MKIAATALALGVLGAAPAGATLIASDLFNAPGYRLGDDIYPNSNQDIGFGPGVGGNDGTGFTTGWQNPAYTAVRTAAPGLTYSGLATAGFSAAGPAYLACTYCVNSTAIRDFANNTATSDLWISFLIKDDTATDFQTYPNYGGIAVEDAGGDFVYVGVPGLTAPTADYSLQTGADVSAQSAVAASIGPTVLLVADISSSGTASLWVDPTLGGSLEAPDATIAAPFVPSAATELYWSDSWGWSYGDIRVGTTFADVTPAPSTAPEPRDWMLVLLGLGGLGAVARARGRLA